MPRGQMAKLHNLTILKYNYIHGSEYNQKQSYQNTCKNSYILQSHYIAFVPTCCLDNVKALMSIMIPTARALQR